VAGFSLRLAERNEKEEKADDKIIKLPREPERA
jgi:hypothetical protein